MVYFSIALMFPIAAQGSTIILFWMKGGFTDTETKLDVFKKYIFYYMVVKTCLSFLCALLSFFNIDDSKVLPHSVFLHEESRKLGFIPQLKLLLTNKLYLVFVYGPLVSMSLIGSTDNHLESLLLPFGISMVSSNKL